MQATSASIPLTRSVTMPSSRPDRIRTLLADLIAFDTVSDRSQPAPDCPYRELPRRARHQKRTHHRCDRTEGLAVGHDRTRGPAGPGAVGPYRRRSRRRPGLEPRSVQAYRARRQALRPRHHRHEGLCRGLPCDGAGDAGGQVRRLRSIWRSPMTRRSAASACGRCCARSPKRKSEPLGAFIGEPTQMQVIIGRKGKHGVRATFRGLARHSSIAPDGVNAIEYAAELIVEIRRRAVALAGRAIQRTASTMFRTRRCSRASCMAALR